MTTTFEVNQTTTAQIGNPGERSYKENAAVTVLATKEIKHVGMVYLIQIEEGFIGAATVYPEPNEIKGQLYCIDGRRYGEDKMFPNLESASLSLGF